MELLEEPPYRLQAFLTNTTPEPTRMGAPYGAPLCIGSWLYPNNETGAYTNTEHSIATLYLWTPSLARKYWNI